MRAFVLAVLVGIVALVGVHPADAAEAVVKGAMFIKSNKSLFRALFNQFTVNVNKAGKGSIRFAPVIGPEAIPRREMGNAVSSGILDVAALPPAYYRGLMIEADALQLATVSPAEQRRNGAIALLQEKYHAAGWHFLAQYGHGIQFHVFLNKRVKTLADFKGLRLRTTPTYREFFARLGANQLETSRGEVYTAMERGVVDGYANVMSEVAPAGWDKVTKFRVDPGFYHAIVTITMNLKRWDGLSKAQRAILSKASAEVEGAQATAFLSKDKAAGKRMVDKGMKVISLSGGAAGKYLSTAQDAYWALLEKERPATMKKLRPLLSK